MTDIVERNRMTSTRLGRATTFYKNHLIDRYSPAGPLFLDEEKEVLIEVFFGRKQDRKKVIKFEFDENMIAKNAFFITSPDVKLVKCD